MALEQKPVPERRGQVGKAHRRRRAALPPAGRTHRRILLKLPLVRPEGRAAPGRRPMERLQDLCRQGPHLAHLIDERPLGAPATCLLFVCLEADALQELYEGLRGRWRAGTGSAAHGVQVGQRRVQERDLVFLGRWQEGKDALDFPYLGQDPKAAVLAATSSAESATMAAKITERVACCRSRSAHATDSVPLACRCKGLASKPTRHPLQRDNRQRLPAPTSAQAAPRRVKARRSAVSEVVGRCAALWRLLAGRLRSGSTLRSASTLHRMPTPEIKPNSASPVNPVRMSGRKAQAALTAAMRIPGPERAATRRITSCEEKLRVPFLFLQAGKPVDAVVHSKSYQHWRKDHREDIQVPDAQRRPAKGPAEPNAQRQDTDECAALTAEEEGNDEPCPGKGDPGGPGDIPEGDGHLVGIEGVLTSYPYLYIRKSGTRLLQHAPQVFEGSTVLVEGPLLAHWGHEEEQIAFLCDPE